MVVSKSNLMDCLGIGEETDLYFGYGEAIMCSGT